jgi:hypothetical protein
MTFTKRKCGSQAAPTTLNLLDSHNFFTNHDLLFNAHISPIYAKLQYQKHENASPAKPHLTTEV